MTIQEWQAIISLILGIGAVAGIIFTVLRFYVKAFAKQELDEIKHELKPNGGSSIKDQVTRLEKKQEEIYLKQKEDDKRFEERINKLEDKIDDVFKIIIDKLGN
jgi:transcriptional/translational regulatory protein YebC/TACO1